ncbi:hypothetical protein KGQ24_01355 [Patescibacteria group bacterium]|nr:hypothetical protein [Patescibacteria group bacterium]
MRIAAFSLVAVLFASLPSGAAAQGKLADDSLVIRSAPVGELRNIGLVDVNLGQEMVSRLGCVSDSTFNAYQKMYAAFVDSVSKVPALNASQQRRRDTSVTRALQEMWKKWLEAHASDACMYKVGQVQWGYEQSAQPSELSLSYHQDNTLQLTRHPAGRPFGPGFTNRDELLKQVRDTTSEDYTKMESCVLKYSGLDTLQAQEYLDSLRTGGFQIKPAPGLIGWNASCGMAPGRNIKYVPEGKPTTAAYVTLKSGLVVAALHSCSNVLTIPQAVWFSIRREGLLPPVVSKAGPVTPPHVAHAKLVAYKMVMVEGQPGTIGDSVTVNVGEEVRFHLYARVDGDGSISGVRVSETFWPSALRLLGVVLPSGATAPNNFFEALTSPIGLVGAAPGIGQTGEVFNFDLVAAPTAPGRYVNIAEFYSDSGNVTDSAVVIVRGPKPVKKAGYCSTHKLICIGGPVIFAGAIIWLLHGHGHAAMPTKPVGKPGTCTNSAICDRVPQVTMPIRP